MFEKILNTLEEYEQAYNERENEFPCKYYAGRSDQCREIWDIIANAESDAYKQYEQLKAEIRKADLPPERYEQLVRKAADILGV